MLPLQLLIRSPQQVGDLPGITAAGPPAALTRARLVSAGGSQATNVHFYNGDLYVTVAAKEAVFKLPLGGRGWRYSKGCGY